ncbi:MAG: hypothetical protein HDR07_11355 [Lachnospiraceae bacterium]|nr:hypothetical protein [Lachnospiraceae bacterium]
MDKTIAGLTVAAIILLLILASCLWYKLCVPSLQDDILFMMRAPRLYKLLGAAGIVFFSIMGIPFLFAKENYLFPFIFFFCAVIFYVYFLLAALLWRCVIKEDSVTFYNPLLPTKKIKFYEIDFVHLTDNPLPLLSGGKILIAYRGKKKLFDVPEATSGFYFLCDQLYQYGKLEYIPRPAATKEPLAHIPVVESFSVTQTTEEIVRTIVGAALLIPVSVYILWDRAEFELIYQIIAVVMLILSLDNLLQTLLWKVTVDYRTICIRYFIGVVKTYDIREITKVEEQKVHIILYAGDKKIAKIAKDRKNFQYLFERLMRTEAEIYRKD